MLLLLSLPAVLLAQDGIRLQPKWWFGGAVGANYNWYDGTAQVINNCLTSPTPFHKGSGLGPYGGIGIEFRPNPVWGGMLYVAYDDRQGKWDNVICPKGNTLSLETNRSYLSIEPSLRVAPFSSKFYMFIGPRVGLNLSKMFTFKVNGNIYAKDQWSDLRATVVSGQVGAGYDVPLSHPLDPTQIVLSPFVAYHPYFGQNPRTTENWAITTVRAGVILKIGHATVENAVARAPVMAEEDVVFTVRAPLAVPVKRRVRETFPLRNYVFFDEGSNGIPGRYVALTKDQATSFKEEQLQEVQPKSETGRSLRQMTVYYNILNILGDRMRKNPTITISLSGASDKGPEQGKARAEMVKLYLVNVFGIDSSRISTEGRTKPRIPSEQPGGTKELDLLRAGDQRVDIESSSPEMLVQVGGAPHDMLKPVQIVAEVEDPLDSHVFFNVVGAKALYTSWSLVLTDEKGTVEHYGPFTSERETIPGNTILGDRAQGVYTVALVGQTKSGKVVRKETTIRLFHRYAPVPEAIRFSILFDFDKSKTVATYEKFLTEIVVPLIADSSIVVIHGHTDIIGDEDYNYNLSHERAQDAKGILEKAIAKSGKHGVTVEAYEFGEDLKYAPFGNDLPEERFYNRTVIIDIVPTK